MPLRILLAGTLRRWMPLVLLLLAVGCGDQGNESANTGRTTPRPPPKDGGTTKRGPTPVRGDDTDERRTIEEAALRLVKPEGIRSHAWDREKYPDVLAWFQGHDREGRYQIILSSFSKGTDDETSDLSAYDIQGWATTQWWPIFSSNHPTGAISTLEWPDDRPAFLTLPQLASERVVAETPGTRPAAPGAKDLLDALKVVQKADGVPVGQGRALTAYRGALVAVRRPGGRQIVLRYAWDTPQRGYTLSVTLSGEAPDAWSGAIRELLESIDLIP